MYKYICYSFMYKQLIIIQLITIALQLMLMHFMNLKDGIKIFSRVILKRSLNEKSEKEDERRRSKEKRRGIVFIHYIYLVFQVKARQGSTKVSKKAGWNRCPRRIAPATTVHLARDALETNRSHYLSRQAILLRRQNLRRTRERNENSSGEKSPFFLDRFEVEAILYYIRLVKIVFKFSKLVSNDFTDQ